VNYNRVQLGGNLTRDVELRSTSGNQSVANFGMAINRKWKTKEGEQREEVTFIDCEVWGNIADVIAKNLRKGSPIFVDGRLKLDTWEDKEGKKQSRLRVLVETFQYIGGREQPARDDSQRIDTTKKIANRVPVADIEIPF